MILQIEKAIKNKLQNTGLSLFDNIDVTAIDPNEQHRWSRGTVIDVICTGGDHQIFNNEIRQNINLSVILVLEEPRSVEDRHKKLYPLLQGIISLLSWEDLDLEISPLLPGRFREVAPHLSEIGAIAYQIDFTTDYTIDLLPQDDAAELIKISITAGNITDIVTRG